MRRLFLGILTAGLLYQGFVLTVDLNALKLTADNAVNAAVDLNTFENAIVAVNNLLGVAVAANDQNKIDSAGMLFITLFKKTGPANQWLSLDSGKKYIEALDEDERGSVLRAFASAGFEAGVDYIITNFFGKPGALDPSDVLAAMQDAKKNLGKTADEAIKYIVKINEAPLKKTDWDIFIVTQANILHLLIMAIFAEPWHVSAGVEEVAVALVKKIAYESPALLTGKASICDELFDKNIVAHIRGGQILILNNIFSQMTPLEFASKTVLYMQNENPQYAEALSTMKAIKQTLEEEIKKQDAKVMENFARCLKKIAS